MSAFSRLILAVAGVFLAVAVPATAFWGVEKLPPTQQENTSKNHYPVADYAAPEPLDPQKRALRQARGSRYSRGRQRIKELPPGWEELPMNAHFWRGLSALPANESDAVVVGEVVDAQAFVTNDRSAVYSEFTVRIFEVLKCNGTSPLPAETIVAERWGGGVRFLSGRIQYYSVHMRGMPQIGSRYVFFLKRNETGDDFSILTGFELSAGRVVPLDGTADRRAALPFDHYRGYDESDFLKAVRDGVADPLQTSVKPGG